MAISKSLADQRMEIRIGSEFKHEIEAAAAVLGISVSSFVSASALEVARRVRKEHSTAQMNNAERDAFLLLLSEPPEPTEALIDLMKTSVVI